MVSGRDLGAIDVTPPASPQDVPFQGLEAAIREEAGPPAAGRVEEIEVSLRPAVGGPEPPRSLPQEGNIVRLSVIADDDRSVGNLGCDSLEEGGFLRVIARQQEPKGHFPPGGGEEAAKEDGRGGKARGLQVQEEPGIDPTSPPIGPTTVPLQVVRHR